MEASKPWLQVSPWTISGMIHGVCLCLHSPPSWAQQGLDPAAPFPSRSTRPAPSPRGGHQSGCPHSPRLFPVHSGLQEDSPSPAISLPQCLPKGPGRANTANPE